MKQIIYIRGNDLKQGMQIKIKGEIRQIKHIFPYSNKIAIFTVDSCQYHVKIDEKIEFIRDPLIKTISYQL